MSNSVTYEPAYRFCIHGSPVEPLKDGAWLEYFRRELEGDSTYARCVVVVGARTGTHPQLDVWLDELYVRLSAPWFLHAGDIGIGRWVADWAERTGARHVALSHQARSRKVWGEVEFRLNDRFLSFRPTLILDFWPQGFANGNLAEKAGLLGIPVFRVPRVPVRHLRRPLTHDAGPDFSALPEGGESCI